MNYRIFAEKLPDFQVEARNLKNELNGRLSLNIKHLRLINVYDVFGIDETLCQLALYRVFGETVTDRVTIVGDCLPFSSAEWSMVCVEYLPGQFDQRAASAADCIQLLDPSANVVVKSAKLLLFDKTLSAQEIERIKKYIINPVELQEKDLSVLCSET